MIVRQLSAENVGNCRLFALPMHVFDPLFGAWYHDFFVGLMGVIT